MGTVIWIALIAATGQAAEEQVLPIDVMWRYISSLGLVEALTFISFGSVCLFYGWRVFRILVTICFGLLGLALGVWANEQLIAGNVIWLALIFSVFFAVLSVPFMRWGVTILGAFSGGVLTAGVWLAAGLPEPYVWAGGLVGLIAGGMISFIVFKIAVILFTGLGGSTLMVVGVLAVLYQYILDSNDGQFESFVRENQWFLPVLLLAPMLVGMYFQNKLSKTDQDWAG
jgi:hypothetical protein